MLYRQKSKDSSQKPEFFFERGGGRKSVGGQISGLGGGLPFLRLCTLMTFSLSSGHGSISPPDNSGALSMVVGYPQPVTYIHISHVFCALLLSVQN